MPLFSGLYAAHLDSPSMMREDGPPVPEAAVQRLWFSGALTGHALATSDGRPLRIVSPGWWNRGGGPDFRGAQIEIAGSLRTGDVEIDLTHGNWHAHGHDENPAFDKVVLHAVWEAIPPAQVPRTAGGRALPVLLLPAFAPAPVYDAPPDPAADALALRGRCAMAVADAGPERLVGLLRLAGEWRMLEKARALHQRMEQAGPDQAIYEAVMYGCGFGPFKEAFRALARALPYDRAAQLARRDPHLAEAALLVLAGLLPAVSDDAPRHLTTLHALRDEHLPGLRALPGLAWNRAGIRPINYPERRLAGVARFLARTASPGLHETLAAVWRDEATPLVRRRAFEAFFRGSIGFWATRCSWTGKPLPRASALIGAGRVRSLIGNVFVPAALAVARHACDREAEERVYDFFARLPREPGNRVLDAMIPRVFGEGPPPAIDFRLQQGLLQMYRDWCQPNPSCQRCPVRGYWEGDGA